MNDKQLTDQILARAQGEIHRAAPQDSSVAGAVGGPGFCPVWCLLSWWCFLPRISSGTIIGEALF
jgi:hypothetical protein